MLPYFGFDAGCAPIFEFGAVVMILSPTKEGVPRHKLE